MDKKPELFTEILNETILGFIEELYWNTDSENRKAIKLMIAEADYMMENAL